MRLRHNFHGALLTLAISGLLTGCASTGAPMPPSLELPKPPADLKATRKGDRVTLTWTAPSQTTDRQTARRLGPTRICRSVGIVMSQCGTPVGETTTPKGASKPSSGGAGGEPKVTYIDLLPHELEQQNPTGQITYAVEVENSNGRSAGLSNQVQVPAAPTLPPPSDFKTRVTAEGVVLTWRGVPDHQETPEITHHYQVYRRDLASGNETMVGKLPLNDSSEVQLVDHSFEWEKTYEYRATVVTVVALPGKPEMQVEGDDTPPLKLFVHDVFPPAVPAGLQAVFSGVGQQPFVDLIWAPDTDADLAGYNVYRREEGKKPVKLNADLIKTPAYRDNNVVAGKKYLYSVSAVDLRGNESSRSEEASEEIPQTP